MDEFKTTAVPEWEDTQEPAKQVVLKREDTQLAQKGPLPQEETSAKEENDPLIESRQEPMTESQQVPENKADDKDVPWQEPLCSYEINPDRPDPWLVKKWGFGPAAEPFRIVDYERLEEIYAAYAEEHPVRGRQSELSLLKICRWTLQQERSYEEGNWNDVKNLQALIKAELDNEQSRRKEAAQRESARLDDIVAAVEKAGLHMMDYEELCTELANRAFHKTYPYTRDAADKMILLIRNATAWNEGQPELTQLPPELRMDDPLEEFAPKADATEAALITELGL